MSRNLFLKKLDEKLLSYFVLILIISEFITKALILSELNPYRLSTLTKLFFGLFLVYFIYRKKLWYHKILKLFYILALVFLLGQVFIIVSDGFNKEDLLNNLFTFSTYIFLPLIFVCIEFKNTKNIIERNISTLKKVAYLNIPIIIFSLIMPLNIFKSYPHSERFGFNGLLGFSSSASFFYISVIIIFYGIYFQNRTVKNLILLLIQVIISILVGTKTIWFFVILMLVAHFCFLIQQPLKNLFRTLFLIFISIFFFFQEKIELFIVSLFSFGEEYYSKYGFFTVITSTRDLFFKKVLDYYIANFSAPKFLFGGINVINIRVEFEFINMFIFFGLLGFIIYLIIIKLIFYKTLQKPIKTAIFVAILTTCALSGGFFYSVFSVSIFYLSYRYLDFFEKK